MVLYCCCSRSEEVQIRQSLPLQKHHIVVRIVPTEHSGLSFPYALRWVEHVISPQLHYHCFFGVKETSPISRRRRRRRRRGQRKDWWRHWGRKFAQVVAATCITRDHFGLSHPACGPGQLEREPLRNEEGNSFHRFSLAGYSQKPYGGLHRAASSTVVQPSTVVVPLPQNRIEWY